MDLMPKRSNRDLIVELSNDVEIMKHDIARIRKVLREINSFMAQFKIAEEKLKKGENLAESKKGWFFGA